MIPLHIARALAAKLRTSPVDTWPALERCAAEHAWCWWQLHIAHGTPPRTAGVRWVDIHTGRRL